MPTDDATHRASVVQLLLPELRSLLENRPQDAGEIFEELHPADGADLLSRLEDEEVQRLLPHLDPAEAARLLEYVEPSLSARYLQEQQQELAADIVEEMDADDVVEILTHFEDDEQEELLAKMEPEERGEAEALLSHEEGTAGRLMTPYFKTVPLEGTAAQALTSAREGAREGWPVTSLYVVDQSGVLRGQLSLMNVLAAEAETAVEELMEETRFSVRVDTDQEEVARVISKYDLLSVPVTDADDRIVGVITVDDVVDVLTEEATEDAQKLGAVQPLDNPYFQTGFWSMAQKRAVWLVLFFFAELITGNVMHAYEGVLQSALSLVFFVPLILSSGGNSGAQSSTLVTRALAIGEVRLQDIGRVFGRELLMGFALGCVVGIMGYGRALMLDSDPRVAIIVSTTLVGVVTAGTLGGAMLPLILRRIGLDPALSSSAFVASIVDIVGVFLYLTLAKLVLGL